MLRQVYTFSLLGSFFALIFQVSFRRSLFRVFCDFGVPRASQIGAFGVHFGNFFVIGWISENDALARVSARSGRFQGLPKYHIFDVCLGTYFKCVFRTLLFRFFMCFMFSFLFHVFMFFHCVSTVGTWGRLFLEKTNVFRTSAPFVVVFLTEFAVILFFLLKYRTSQ